MSGKEGWISNDKKPESRSNNVDLRSGFNPQTGVYNPLFQLPKGYEIPTSHVFDTAAYVLSQFPQLDVAESRVALVDSTTKQQVTYGQLRRSIKSLAAALFTGLGIRKGDVVLLLSPNSVLYPTICLAVLSIGAILTTANPLNTASEIGKQVRDSGAKIGIAAPEYMDKLAPAGIPTLLTTRPEDDTTVSVEKLIDDCEPLDWPKVHITQSDTAVILYSSGTTGVSKGVILTHSNIISIMTILKWSVKVSSSENDVFLSFIPMFHIYGLVFFGLGLFCSGITSILMPKFDFKAMLEAIQTYKVNNLPAVPPVILALVKYGNCGYDLTSLRAAGTGAAPLSKELAAEFRIKFPWVELRQGYGLTESCGAATFFPTHKMALAHSGSSGMLLPGFSAKIVDPESRIPMPPYKQGELWLKSGAVMKGYLGNEEATNATISSDGWLQTGDLCYFDEDGCLYIVDRLKELIKHNGYQVW